MISNCRNRFYENRRTMKNVYRKLRDSAEVQKPVVATVFNKRLILYAQVLLKNVKSWLTFTFGTNFVLETSKINDFNTHWKPRLLDKHS